MRIVITETGEDSGFTVEPSDDGWAYQVMDGDNRVTPFITQDQFDEWLSNAGMHLASCQYSAAHQAKGVLADTVLDCGPVGRVPACQKCADFYAKH